MQLIFLNEQDFSLSEEAIGGDCHRVGQEHAPLQRLFGGADGTLYTETQRDGGQFRCLQIFRRRQISPLGLPV